MFGYDFQTTLVLPPIEELLFCIEDLFLKKAPAQSALLRYAIS